MVIEPRHFRHVFIEGNVQGVGYREFVRRWAIRLDVSGWVRNRSDGSVQACLYGACADLEALIVEMRKGPPGALVARLLVDANAAGDSKTSDVFAIRPTEQPEI